MTRQKWRKRREAKQAALAQQQWIPKWIAVVSYQGVTGVILREDIPSLPKGAGVRGVFFV